jgi:hypothetical protein
METIIKDNLLKYLQSHNIISIDQHGFVPSKSTCSQLLEAEYDWCSCLDEGGIVDVITIDFRKAFDVVPHNKLISKLACIGICRQTLCWISEFLKNRKQCVNINNKCSEQSSVASGVIQGSVLGPLLFTLYINDLPTSCPNCTIKLFADDVKAYKRIRSPLDRSVLQQSLNNLCEWANQWDLGLSIEKCNFFQLGYKNLTLIYKLNNEIIPPCDSIVDLGIHFYSNLKFGHHCSAIVSKANLRAKLILKTFLSRNPFIIARAFVVYVRPLLEYCTPVWSPHNKRDIELLESVQRTFTRKLFHYCHLQPVSYDDRLTFLGLQRLELRRIYTDLIFMFKLTHNIIPNCSLTRMLCFANHVHTRGHRYKLFFNRSNKLIFSNYFINRVTPIWNYLSDNCFTPDNLLCFKHKLCSVDFTCFLKGRS